MAAEARDAGKGARAAPRFRERPEHVGRALGPLTALPGVGPARERAFARLGVDNLRDLLFLMPSRLEVHEAPVPLAEAPRVAAERSREVTVHGVVKRSSLLRQGGKRSLLRVTFEDSSGTLDAMFFNQPWLAERFLKGAAFQLRGRIVGGPGAKPATPSLAAPRVGTEEKPLPVPGSLVPLYPTVEGLSQDLVRRLCGEVAERFAERLEETLRDDELARADALPIADAVREVHAPTSVGAFARARRRLALEPLLRLQARLVARRARGADEDGDAFPAVVDDALAAEIEGRFPFELTAGQRAIVADLRADLARRRPMRRLLQGDVGSGKTVLGLWACIAVARNGAQCAFLAPTELLAEQHFEGLRPLLASLGLSAVLLTSSVPAAERKQVLAQLASGMADVAFGTHALFSADVRYRNLALAVIDEQQRFGVGQRARILDKGRDVHALLMTATPIPRTLALTLYGDLDTSVLREAPAGRGKVGTRWVRGQDRERVPEFLRERLAAGEQVYWVVPRIGSADGTDEEVLESARSGAESAFERLRASDLARHGVELVHGRMSAAERASRLDRFRAGRAGVLVATTVIEVGVDVPDATVMVIENAERLGLAQLHQLRGRIGRGAKGGWCLLFGDRVAAERFELLERTSDGFEIAEEDLRLRGMGDLAGLRQAGDNAEGLGDPALDVRLILLARELVETRPELARAYDDEGTGDVTP